jgi:hypothetical protein
MQAKTTILNTKSKCYSYNPALTAENNRRFDFYTIVLRQFELEKKKKKVALINLVKKESNKNIRFLKATTV